MALNGEFTPPGDKSISHRLVLMSLLAEGEMAVSGLSDCDDVKVSLSLFRALGGRAQGGGSRWTLGGLGGLLSVPQWEAVELDCGNSGTTMRLLSGVLAGIPGKYILDGDQQLRRRPMERLADPLRQMGARLDTNNGRAPLTIEGGPLHGLEYVNSDASAQLKGALLLAALQASGPSKIIEPRPTRDHTERLINLFGGQVCTNNAPQNTALEIQPGRLTLAPELAVPGDPSSAAFFLIGAAMMPGSWVTAANMLLSSARIGFLKVLDRMGANISISLTGELPEPNGRVTVEYNGPLMATEIGAEEVPSIIDEIPMLALAAASAKGVTVFRQVRELRLKESDRLTGIKHQLGALGVEVRVENDDLIIKGPEEPHGMMPTRLGRVQTASCPNLEIKPERLDSDHDHRLAMTLHLALAAAGRDIPILGDESISVSYPAFKADLARLRSGKAEP